jgi:NAD(P)-dependent dehydrogenase (short-subunit alcohol dehydrogenase family)
MHRLRDKVCLVTGAAQGIGKAIGQAFASEGAVVILADVQDDLGPTVATRIGAAARFQHLDVRSEDEWTIVLADVMKTYKRFDVLVNNAGVTGFHDSLGPQDPEHISLASWRAVHATNLEGVFLGCKHAIRTMRQCSTPGSIVNISSRSGLVGIPRAAAYASSKAGVRNHTKSVALYCAEERLDIRCNSIHPAAILTPMWDPLLGAGPEREIRMRQYSESSPFRRFGRAEEVAQAAVFLASDESSYISGIELNVDGAMLAGTSTAPQEPQR